jgi:hypothetical protein
MGFQPVMDNVDDGIPIIACLQCSCRNINVDYPSWNNQRLVSLDTLKAFGTIKVLLVLSKGLD